jgi:hypothetical protein
MGVMLDRFFLDMVCIYDLMGTRYESIYGATSLYLERRNGLG